MTAAELLSEADFQALCRCWMKYSRCPLVLPDWLRERSLDRQAEVAEWAVRYRDRTVWCSYKKGGPTPCKYENGWQWDEPSGHWADSLILPTASIAKEQKDALFIGKETAAEAIVALLFHFAPKWMPL